MANVLLAMLQNIEQERGISRDLLVGALETAILTAARKSIHPANQLKVKVDPETGDIKAWAILEVVESNPTTDQLLYNRAVEKFPDIKLGDVVEWEVTPRNFGRIAAQTARQAIMQQLRKAEKLMASEEFANSLGQIITGKVRQFDGGNIIIDFQKAQGILPIKEKIPGEQYMVGDLINALLLKIDVASSGPSLIVSRSHPDFVRRLFEREVAEIRDGVVTIMNVAREAGSRTKISVASSDSRVDPVGSCVGIRGSRVRAVTDELNNERIDIVPYDSDIVKYCINALQPAKAQSVEVDESRHELIVFVSPEQSKLVFGKKAQNVRLSSKLLNWNITIRTIGAPHENMEDKIRRAAEELAGEFGVSEETANILVHNGYITCDGLRAAGREQIMAVEGLDPDEISAAFDRLEAENQ
ncbi:MAG: transcription termination factor NusA [Victivallaceae bacterium]|nr:transcription termination factor NusA [Victivallaceae bacterium]